MKKLLGVAFVLLLLTAKAYCQTTIPFYGFELSNYEVGDTLEYATYYMSLPGFDGDNYDTDIYRIINKQVIGPDTIKYTMQDTYFYNLSDGMSLQSGRDTLQQIITNNFAYNNFNNILGLPLAYCADSSYPYREQYDTINGLKKLRAANFYQQYNLIQNLGVVSDSIQNCGVNPVSYVNLMYANLAHYGVYGKYNSVVLGISNIASSVASVSIRYDNGKPILFISSTQNLPSPTLSAYDLLGRELQTIPVTVGNNLLNLNGFAKGMYLYKVTSNGTVLGQGKLMNL